MRFNTAHQATFSFIVSHVLRTLHLYESDLACVRTSDRACKFPLGKTVGLFGISCDYLYLHSVGMSSAALQFWFV